jgi:PST family polysaccharide transporter
MLLQAGIQIGSVFTTIVLARILSPADFGLLAIVNSVIGLAGLISAGGLGAALIRRAGPVSERASSYFNLSALLGIFSTITISALAFPLSHIFGQPNAALYIAVLAPTLTLTFATAIPQALLKRERLFGRVYFGLAVGATVYFIGQICLALRGWGPWSVIIAQLLSDAVTLAFALISCRWRPTLTLNWRLVIEDLRYASGLSVSQVLAYLVRNCDYWLLSRAAGPAALGTYYIAYVIPNILRQRVSWAAQSVLFVYFSRRRDDRDACIRMWREVWRLQAGLGIPVLAMIATTAEPLIATVFGEGWAGAAQSLPILAVAAMVDLHLVTVSTAANALGYIGLSVKILGIRVIATVAGVATCLFLSPQPIGAACGVAIGGIFALIIQERTISPRLGIGLRTVWRDIVVFATCSAFMALAMAAIGQSLEGSSAPARLLLMICAGAVTYLACGLLFFRKRYVALLQEVRAFLISR